VNDDLAIETVGLTKRFGAFAAVDSVDLSVRTGEVFGFLGPNGCGKSTTIRMLCGLLRPTSGSARVAGFDVVRQSERIRERLGYVGQFFYLYGDLTVIENMELYGGVYGVPYDELRKRMGYWLERVELEEHGTSRGADLSVGFQRRLSLVCAVLHKPSVLLLDEPTSGVDPLARRSFFEVIGELQDAGTTILVTTHVMDEAERCNRLALMSQGRLEAVGTPAEIKAMSGSGIYSIAVSDLVRAVDLLHECPLVEAAQPFGTEAQFQLVAGDDTQAREVARWLGARGISCGDPRPVRPTIEHTFLRILGRRADTSRGGGG